MPDQLHRLIAAMNRCTARLRGAQLFIPILLSLPLAACRKESPASKTMDHSQPAIMSPALSSSVSLALSSHPLPPESTETSPSPPLPPDEVIHRPKAISAGEKLPFILWLHGLGASGELLRSALHVDALAELYHFAFACPEGTMDSMLRRFWNASPVCCDFDHQGVDHVTRLTNILRRAESQSDIDPKRLFVVGFSNGGFMAHRLACSKSAHLAGIASMAGLGPSQGEACTPARPVRILEIHGGSDIIVRPEGGRLFDDPSSPEHPALRVTVDSWAKRNQCATLPPTSKSVDLIPNLTGKETTEISFAKCAASVELWTIAGGGHMSVNAPGVVKAALEGLLTH